MTSPRELIRLLRVRPNTSAADVRAALGISPATLMRMVRAAGPEVLTIGRGRRTSYAARRALGDSDQPLPIFQIDERGRYDQVAKLTLAFPHGSTLEWMPPCPWPLDASMQDGWFEGLPYFLQDLRPEGFLGRAFARATAQMLGLGPDPKDWSEEATLLAMSRFGTDPIGNLIIGDMALQRYLGQLQQPNDPVPEAQVPVAYAEYADQAMAEGLPGSSAAGEFPKFTAAREDSGDTVKVLVKFSGSDQSVGSQRWSDLLISEHLAALVLNQALGIEAARTRILQAAGRTFLEGVRFDRHGAHGRSAVCTWSAINNAWFGMAGRPWPQGAARLRALKLIDPATERAVAQLWHFGKLIANTDMHDGNLSFRPHQIRGKEGFALAPAYDMLPMHYAPARGVELPVVNFRPMLPLPAEREDWMRAAQAALRFWDLAAQDARISQHFRQICAENLQHLQAMTRLAS